MQTCPGCRRHIVTSHCVFCAAGTIKRSIGGALALSLLACGGQEAPEAEHSVDQAEVATPDEEAVAEEVIEEEAPEADLSGDEVAETAPEADAEATAEAPSEVEEASDEAEPIEAQEPPAVAMYGAPPLARP